MPNDGPRIAGAGTCCPDHIVVAPSIPWGEASEVEVVDTTGAGDTFHGGDDL